MATGTYTDPKVWQVGLAIIKGDIFQVTEAQAAIYPYAYQAGDFYQARYNFTIVDESYPYRENSDSQWQWQGSKWSHAKHWVGGSVVKKGDIFQVTEAQAATYSYAYQAGDFYQARYNFTIVDESYPYRENSNNTWQWQGDKLAHPATWAIGLEVEKGDIFLIRVGDEGGGTIGSYYQATNNFIIGADDKYPDRESDNHNWQWIDSRWHHAKHWVSGLAIIKGDIFRVTAAEAEQSPNYQAGAFYLALKDGVVGDVSYPASGTSNSQWQWQGEKWYHTFRWVEGLAVKKGDIFQVTEAQAAGSSGTYQAGDFYEALKDGVVGDDNIYPDSGNSDSQWQWQGDKWFHPKYWASNLLVGVGDIFQVRVGDGAEYWVYFQATYNGYIDGNRAYPAAEGSNSNWIRQGNKWAHPGLWVPGLEVKKGKVFQVQDGDPGDGKEGYYYEAQSSFTIGDATEKYPDPDAVPANSIWQWQGDKWAHPKYWQGGSVIKKGDIFQATDADAAASRWAYHGGDFYLALKDGVVSDAYYPASGASNSQWQWQGDKWYHPLHWIEGSVIKKGDIFQITAADAESTSGTYKAGDFYEALEDGVVGGGDKEYPDSGTSNDYWQWQGDKWAHPRQWLIGLEVEEGDIFQVTEELVASSSGRYKAGDFYQAFDNFTITVDDYLETGHSTGRWQWQGGKWDHPFYWAPGSVIKKGDIFQVTAADAAGSSAYNAGDFYEARTDGLVGDASYSDSGTSDSHWLWQGDKWSHPRQWLIGLEAKKGDIFQVTAGDMGGGNVGDFYQSLEDGYIGDESYPDPGNSSLEWQWQGDKWSHPVHWIEGSVIKKGDIFQITAASTSGRYNAVDFYEALKDFTIGDESYPASGTSSLEWQWQGDKWYHPLQWIEGSVIKKGDIFQITAAEAESTSAYNAGDFYLALKDGVGDINNYYPASRSSSSSWEWQGSKWFHPRQLCIGLKVEKGDIFQVTAVEAAGSSGRYKAGDFYEALNNFTLGDDASYPDSGSSFGNWQWQGDKWYHPLHWIEGSVIKKGDIFQVTEEQAASYPGGYKAGDFYEALKDGIFGDASYPHWGYSSSNWQWQGSKWFHPMHQCIGLEVENGDIFQVTAVEEASSSGRYKAGDYYEALNNFTIAVDNYLDSGTHWGFWQWQGDKWDHPLHWVPGLVIKKGDIFQVTEADVAGPSAYHAGDFYEALKDGVVGDAPYPDSGSSSSSWQWQGNKWFHPKVWYDGYTFKKGDIFQVEQTSSGASPASGGTSGDYYVALKDGDCGSSTLYPSRENSNTYWQWQGTKWHHPAAWATGLLVSKYDIFQVQDGDPGDGKEGYYYEAQSSFTIGDATEKYPDPDNTPAKSLWLWKGDKWDHPCHWLLNLEVEKGDMFQTRAGDMIGSAPVGEYYIARFSDKITTQAYPTSNGSSNSNWQLDEPQHSGTHSDFIKPKHWQPAEAVQEKDIFQVTAADIARQPSTALVVGDYYEALFTGDIYNENYPERYKTNDYWKWIAAIDDWLFTENVGVTFADASDDNISRSIYANGINMVRVDVHLDALNGHKDIIKNPNGGTLRSAIQLINYSTGQPLNSTGNYAPTPQSANNNGWCYSYDYNDYSDIAIAQIKDESASEVIRSVESGNATASGGLGQTIISFYVFAQNLTASDGKLSITVSARITLPQNPAADISGTGGSVLRQVQLKVIANPIFTQENIGVFTINSGNWSPSSESTLDSIDQDNYYLHIQGVVGDEVKYSPVLVDAKIETGFFSSDNTLDDVSSYLNGRCWSYKSYQYDNWLTTHMYQYYHCIWPFDPTTKKYDVSIPIFSGYGSHRTRGFVTMSHGGEYQYPAVCLTRLSYHYAPGIGGGTSSAYDCHVKLYDQYGNSFWVTVIRNTNSGNSLTFVPGISTSNP